MKYGIDVRPSIIRNSIKSQTLCYLKVTTNVFDNGFLFKMNSWQLWKVCVHSQFMWWQFDEKGNDIIVM